MDDVLKLPAIMDVARARAIHETLVQHRGTPLTIDASEVEKASTLGFEVLISAERQWRSDGIPFDIVNVPETVRKSWLELGLGPTFGVVAADPNATEGSAA